MRKSRLSQDKQEQLIGYFVSGATALTAAALVGVHRNTAALYFHRLRQRIPASAGMTSAFAGAGLGGAGMTAILFRHPRVGGGLVTLMLMFPTLFSWIPAYAGMTPACAGAGFGGAGMTLLFLYLHLR